MLTWFEYSSFCCFRWKKHQVEVGIKRRGRKEHTCILTKGRMKCRRQEHIFKLQANPLVTRQVPLMPRTLPDNFQPFNSGFEVLKHDVTSFPLPEWWQVLSDLNSVEYCCFGRDEDGTRQVAKSISIKSNLTWVVKVQVHLVPATCNALALASHLPKVLSTGITQALLKGVNQAILCPQKPRPRLFCFVP